MPETLIIDENEEEQETPTEKTHKPHKQWYASAWFWIIIGLTISMGVGLIWYFGVFAPNRTTSLQKTDAEKTIDSQWQEVVQEAEKFTKTTTRADSIDDFSALATYAAGLTDAIETAQKKYELQDLIKDPAYTTALSDLATYVDGLQTVLDKKKEDIKETDIASLKNPAATAKTSVNAFTDEADFVNENILAEFYNVQITLQTLFDSYTAQVKIVEEAKKKEADAAAAKALAEAADKKGAEAAVTNFTNAYIDGNLDTLKTFMTASFKTEFNYSQREDGYYLPTSYRIVDSVKNSDARYYAYGRMTEKVVGGTDQFSYDWNFTIVKQSGKWLIDLDQAPAR